MYTTNQCYDSSTAQEGYQVRSMWKDSCDAPRWGGLPPLSATNKFIRFKLNSNFMERAKSVVHVEFEVFRHVLETIDVADLRDLMVPEGDTVAEKRFDSGVKSAAELIANLAMRRQHKLPQDHSAYIAKGD